MSRWIALCFGLVGAFAATAADTPVPNVRPGIPVPAATGVAELTDNYPASRDRAWLDAKRRAVEMGLGVMVKSTTKVDLHQLVEDKIDVQSVKGFVFDDQVIKEQKNEADKTISVTISCRVGTKALVCEIAEELPSVYAIVEKPRLAVLLNEKQADGTKGDAVTTGLAKCLLDRGLDVVEKSQIDALADRDKVAQTALGNGEAIAWLAAQLNIEILVCGSAATTAAGCNVQARVVNAWDARIIAAGVAQGASPLAAARGLVPGPRDSDDLVVTMLGGWLANPTLLTLTLSRMKFSEVQNLVKQLQPTHRQTAIDMTQAAAGTRLPAIGAALLRNYNPTMSTVEVRTPLRRMPAIDAISSILDGVGYGIGRV